MIDLSLESRRGIVRQTAGRPTTVEPHLIFSGIATMPRLSRVVLNLRRLALAESQLAGAAFHLGARGQIPEEHRFGFGLFWLWSRLWLLFLLAVHCVLGIVAGVAFRQYVAELPPSRLSVISVSVLH
jgi:hypothetical protein